MWMSQTDKMEFLALNNVKDVRAVRVLRWVSVNQAHPSRRKGYDNRLAHPGFIKIKFEPC